VAGELSHQIAREMMLKIADELDTLAAKSITSE
jgi:hypothetical protein